MEPSILTPLFTLVPSAFFDKGRSRELLSGVACLDGAHKVDSIELPGFGAVLVYAVAENTSVYPENNVSGKEALLPEIFHILESLQDCSEYNKILCSWAGGYLYMAIAQGASLMMANAFAARDFTTAQYHIFNALKSLQLNPEVSVISWRIPLEEKDEMSLYRYFKSVERL